MMKQSAVHKLALICALAMPMFAVAQNHGQATVISGHASNRMQVAEGTASADAPLINTPSVTLGAAPPSAANGPFATLTWYGPGTPSETPEEPSQELEQPQEGNISNVGVGASQDSKGVAQLMAEEQTSRQVAARVYTNRDVARLVQQLNLSVGLVRYADKTEQLY
jgi:hypothetical protein